MRAYVVSSLLLLVLAPVVTPSHPHPDPARTAEVRRIRSHFDSVLAELPARDPSALTPAQRARRGALLATLRAYRDRGEFPHNYDFPGQAVPYFVDRETGALCAVAHLLAATGRRDVVDRVARADNNAWVSALAGDTAFTGWLRQSGLTLGEAARIQVPYGGSVSTAGVVLAPMSVATTAGALTLTAVNAGTNAGGAGRVRTALGLTFGAAAMGVGAATLTQGLPPGFGAASLAAGAASAWIATRGLVRHRHTAARAREASLARRAVVAPVLPVGRDGGAGVAVTLPF